MEQPYRSDRAIATPHQTRTLVLRLMCDEHGIWHAALSEPSSLDGWRITCAGLDVAWRAMLSRLGCPETKDSREDI